MSRPDCGTALRTSNAPIRLLQRLNVRAAGLIAGVTVAGLGFRLLRRPLPWTSAQVDRLFKPAAATTVLAGLLLLTNRAAQTPARRAQAGSWRYFIRITNNRVTNYE